MIKTKYNIGFDKDARKKRPRTCQPGRSAEKMTKMHNIPSSAQDFITHLSKLPFVEKIVLFGSRALGDNESGADIDLAVSAPGLNRAQFARLRVEAFEARTLFWISLVHLEQTPDPLRKRINLQGVVIYEREKTPR